MLTRHTLIFIAPIIYQRRDPVFGSLASACLSRMSFQKQPFPMSLAALALLVFATMAPRMVDCFLLGGGSSCSCSVVGRSSNALRDVPELLFLSNSNNKNNSNDNVPFSPEELVAMTKDYIANPSPDWWSSDFVFRGPVIGPLCKKDLVNTLEANADLQTAFPDLQANAFGFCADDPIEANRVWFFVRPRGTFSGPFKHPTKGTIEPTNARYVAPPEARSVVFDKHGKIKYQSVGYVVDRFTGDTTGGRGAVFGQYAVMGEELDPNPGSWTLSFLQKLGEYLPNVPKSYSKPEDVPSWWNDERKGAEA